MLQLINLPYDIEIIESHGNIEGLKKILRETKCDSFEWIYSGRYTDIKLPKELTQGYHLTFYSDWLDFYLKNEKRILQKFDSWENIEIMYGSRNPDILIKNYSQDLKRAISLGAKYVVFHIADVSIEEGYSYNFEHSDKDVLDASAEIINEILKDIDTDIDFLIENLWWAGFRFTDKKNTQYILNKINYSNKGIMLDTGHLLNTNTTIKTEYEGIKYIDNILDKQKDFIHFIKGIHLNKSISGEYVNTSTGINFYPKGNTYFEKFTNSYSHILKIDQHKPFEDPKICEIIEKINPKYIVHEISGPNIQERIKLIKTQRNTICNISTK